MEVIDTVFYTHTDYSFNKSKLLVHLGFKDYIKLVPIFYENGRLSYPYVESMAELFAFQSYFSKEILKSFHECLRYKYSNFIIFKPVDDFSFYI